MPQRVILVDDGSSDSTEELVKAFKSPVPVDYIKKENGGISSARNVGIKHSKADLVAFLDADDLWRETKLEKQVAVFQHSNVENLENLGVVYCDYGLINEVGETIENHRRYRLEPELRGNIFAELLIRNRVAGSASGVLIRRTCFDAVGDFDENLSAGEDWDMWIRLAASYGFDYVNEELVDIRRHKNNVSNGIQRMLIGDANVLYKYNQQIPRRVVDELVTNIFINNIKSFFGPNVYCDCEREFSPDVKSFLFQNPLKSIINGLCIKVARRFFKL